MEKALTKVIKMQQNELDEHEIYLRLAALAKTQSEKDTLTQIANEEYAHAKIWERVTGKSLSPRKLRVAVYSFLGMALGYTFAIKKMENGEEEANEAYDELAEFYPEAKSIAADEQRHERELIDILDEDRLHYVGSMVLGLNDALVEITGTLAGLTFALQNTRLIALSGLITGISATLSMASSEYLSAHSEGNKDAFKSCLYTGVMYLFAVSLLVLPYLLFSPSKYLAAMFTMFAIVILIILFFTYYISVAKDLPFKRRFLEMAVISLSVAAVSFLIGLLVKQWLGIDV